MVKCTICGAYCNGMILLDDPRFGPAGKNYPVCHDCWYDYARCDDHTLSDKAKELEGRKGLR